LDGKLIRGKTFQVPLTNSGIINEELSELHIIGSWNTSSVKIIIEQLTYKLGSEFRVERTTVRDKGAGLGDISDESRFKRLELIGILNPTLLVVLEGVNKTVGLVHLLSGLGCFLLKGILLCHLIIKLFL
jgi:hypothetical protein